MDDPISVVLDAALLLGHAICSQVTRSHLFNQKTKGFAMNRKQQMLPITVADLAVAASLDQLAADFRTEASSAGLSEGILAGAYRDAARAFDELAHASFDPASILAGSMHDLDEMGHLFDDKDCTSQCSDLYWNKADALAHHLAARLIS